jgi:transaldolase
VYTQTDGLDGYVSLEVNPKLASNTEATIAEARRLFRTLGRPNVLIKVPATDEGIPAIETLIGEGINVNVTLIFSLAMYEKVMAAYISGLHHLNNQGGDVRRVASVASFFVSRVDTLVDKLLEQKRSPTVKVDHLFGRAAIANAKLAYQRFQHVFETSTVFCELARTELARVQRPLWASTSTKNPAYPPTKYVDGLVGEDTVNTMPPKTLQATLTQGRTEVSLLDDLSADAALFHELRRVGIDIDQVTDQLRREGVAAFTKSYTDLLGNLAEKQERLRTPV